MARAAEDQTCTHRFGESPGLCSILDQFPSLLPLCTAHLVADLFLVLSREIHKVVIFCANQEWYSSLVEASTLSVPLFYAVQRRFPGKIEHEEDCNCIVADKWEHVDKFSLTAEIPN